MATDRFRLKFMFWLDIRKSDEFALSEQIEELKQQRTFVKTIRDGIRLICDLRAGRLEVLGELFPWVQAELSKPEKTLAVVSLQTQLERLEYLMGQRIPIPMDAGGMKLTAGPKPLSVPPFSLPRFDDDDADTLVITKSQGSSSATNFVNTMKNLQ